MHINKQMMTMKLHHQTHMVYMYIYHIVEDVAITASKFLLRVGMYCSTFFITTTIVDVIRVVYISDVSYILFFSPISVLQSSPSVVVMAMRIMIDKHQDLRIWIGITNRHY